MGFLSKAVKAVSTGGFSLLSDSSKKGAASGAMSGLMTGGLQGAALGGILGAFTGSGDSYKDIYKYQLANNIALWNMQNAYNTPKAQMLRFKEANLNPNLIYGQTNTASPISTSNLDVNNSGQQQQLSNYMALSNLGIQKDLSSAQVRNIDNSINISQQNLDLQKQRLKLDRDRLNLDAELADAGWLGNIIGRRRSAHMLTQIDEFIRSLSQ